MKEIVIVSCYADTEYKERLLNECIVKLKLLNKDILIATHHPVPDYIVKKVNYYLYDGLNINFEYKTLDNSKSSFLEETSTFKLEYLQKSYTPSLSRMFNLALNFVKQLEYDYFTIIESDSEYELEDLAKLDDIKFQLVKSNKNFFFFKSETDGLFETYCFGGLLYKFLSKFNFVKEYDEWIKLYKNDTRNINLEFYVTDAFNKIRHECLVLDGIKNVFNKSKINVIKLFDPTGIYYNITNETTPILFLMNNQKTIRKFVIRSSCHGVTNDVELNPMCWWFIGIDIKQYNHDISITIFEQENVISRTSFVITRDFMNMQKNTNRIQFK